ncbi:MAG: F0F1 ATP synthase subunit beta, partial [Eubacteriales bacterium]|nr:F0F1 ATP synthase subunit beta [Eubacteriales bacterium]
MASGYVTQIIGPVIDIRFPEQEIPAIHEAVEVKAQPDTIVVEVMQQRGAGVVRCVSFAPTDG